MEKLLQELGLGAKEQIVYKLILEHGKISPALLSRFAKINRTTVYSVAKELKDKGLIVEDLGGKVLYFLPVQINELENIIKKEYEKAEQKEKLIHELKDLLESIPKSKTYSIPKIRFVEESEIEDYLHEATCRWYESMLTSNKTWWGFQDSTFVEKFEKWIDWSWSKAPEYTDLKIFTNKSISEEKMKSKKYSNRRKIKFLNSKEFSATQWVVGNYVIYIMTKQRPFYLVEIHDSVIAHNTLEIFKNLWNKVA